MSEATALLVIDVQIGLIDGQEPSYRRDLVLENIADLLKRAREAQIPIIYIQHEGGSKLIPGARDWQIHPRVAPLDGEIVLSKRAADSFYGTNLQNELQSRGIKHIIIVGCRTEFCVDTTARAAISRNYAVTLVADAHSTIDNGVLTGGQIVAHHNETLDDFGHAESCVEVKSTREISF
ncbi:cysteine hydrolase [Ktedonosporobacter rubrisoli]|uniref:Cysteine hydrolase n=1 Tax=Ktedonosporobacter rubrisoli TaxID=2509675 RepID=A0A4P6JZQ3_KTERU|nr:cysteine hydrolase family protein [Ktedonosporobacter rubrisoli]QBD81388.1 cysteine hydrolase [Ktedonosporobacter rubrisoli]